MRAIGGHAWDETGWRDGATRARKAAARRGIGMNDASNTPPRPSRARGYPPMTLGARLPAAPPVAVGTTTKRRRKTASKDGAREGGVPGVDTHLRGSRLLVRAVGHHDGVPNHPPGLSMTASTRRKPRVGVNDGCLRHTRSGELGEENAGRCGKRRTFSRVGVAAFLARARLRAGVSCRTCVPRVPSLGHPRRLLSHSK